MRRRVLESQLSKHILFPKNVILSEFLTLGLILWCKTIHFLEKCLKKLIKASSRLFGIARLYGPLIFFAGPADFLFWIPRLYGPPRCCAQRLGPQYHPRCHSINSKHANDKTHYKCTKRNEWCNRSSKSSSRAGESFIFMFYENAREKETWTKICQQIFAKLSSRLHESLSLTILWGSKMTPPRALWTPRWWHGEPRWR